MSFIIKTLIILVVLVLLFMGVAWAVGKLNGNTWTEQIQEWFSENNEKGSSEQGSELPQEVQKNGNYDFK
ncbi:MAG: hypothetical protein SPG87_05820 [Eubacteriales bacterium]|nr:hypothetical protein [Eubacteriales bacterium]